MTGTEDKLRDLWAKVLHIAPENIGIYHDFLFCGGDSLEAIALVNAARRRGIHFSVAQLYQLGNIAALAKFGGGEVHDDSHIPSFSLLNTADITKLQAIAAQQCDIKIGLVQDIVPTLDMQSFYLHCQRRQPYTWQVFLAYDLPRDIDLGRVRRAWEELLGQYPITKTRFIDTYSGLLQVILKEDKVHWRSETSLTELLEACKTEDMSFRQRTHQSALLEANNHMPRRLIWYVNHAIVDQITYEHIVQELSALYQGHTGSLLKRKPFKSLVRHRLNSDKMSAQRFWQSRLSGAKYVALFKAINNTQSVACSRLSCEASIKLPRWLKNSGYSSVVTAWAIAFTRFAGVKDIPFVMMRAGRASTLPGSEDMMGPLLTRAPLRVSVERGAAIVDLLRHVNRDIEDSRSFEILREEGFRCACPEAPAHLEYGIYVNFVPPSAGLNIGPDALFALPGDVRDGIGSQTLPFILSGELRYWSIKMDVTWDEQCIPRECIQMLLNDFQSLLQSLVQLSLNMTVNDVLSV